MPNSSSRNRLLKPYDRKAPTITKTRTAEKKKTVKFCVQNKIITVNKSTVCNSSPVFQAMFGGQFEIPVNGVKLTDISPEGFQILIKAIEEQAEPKTGRARKAGPLIQQLREVCLDKALEILCAVNKYLILNFESEITKYISRCVDWSTVLQVLPYADILNNILLKSKCWSIIERFTTLVVQTPAFERISWELLCSILENPHLKVNEYLLFNRVISWCQSERRGNKENTDKTIREILGVAVYKLRFPLMTRAEFVIAKHSGLLAAGEVEDLVTCFRKNRTFINTNRKNICQCMQSNRTCRLCVHNGRLSSQRPQRILTVGNDVDAQCHCIKYISCPNFPNGATGAVFLELES